MPRLHLVTNSYIQRMVGVCYIQAVPEAWLQAANSRIQPFAGFLVDTTHPKIIKVWDTKGRKMVPSWERIQFEGLNLI